MAWYWRRLRYWFRDHKIGRCMTCRRLTLLHHTPSMTMYVDESLNESGFKCRACKDEYCEHWAERWEDYYGGLL